MFCVHLVVDFCLTSSASPLVRLVEQQHPRLLGGGRLCAVESGRGSRGQFVVAVVGIVL